MPSARQIHLETLLRQHGPQTAAAIARNLGVSQPTVSRLLAAEGERIARIGRARATRYALARDIAHAGNRWPIYRITAEGQPERLGQLRALHGDPFHVHADRPTPSLLHPPHGDGLFPGLPWFLDDMRPQGFIGRNFGRRVAADIGTDPDITLWRPGDIVLALLRHASDTPGDLVLGESMLERALRHMLSPPDTLTPAQRSTRYPALALAALQGDPAGSSTAGEQPKFTAIVREDDVTRAVIVKFNDAADTPAARRWADLLGCEHLAAQVLREHGHAAAENHLVDAGGRRFLESTRFDRTPVLGRQGFVSLASLDAAFHGHGHIDWWRYAPQLEREGWIDADSARQLRLLGWFGALIANHDMHLGNAGLILTDTRPLRLAPAYDMLPMAFRPAGNGEIVPRDYAVPLPTPETLPDWTIAAALALTFWQRAADDPRISPPFQIIARQAAERLHPAIQRLT